MPLGKAIFITVLLLISSSTGCTFLGKTKFTLLSLTIDDDEGFPQLSMQFNTSDKSTFRVIDPQQKLLFSGTYYSGIHTENITFGRYRTTVVPGTYTIKAVDASGNIIFEKQLLFRGCNLSIISVEEDWLTEKTEASIVAFHLGVKNSGDLPAYPFNISISHGTTSLNIPLIPTVVLPFREVQIPCFIEPSKIVSSGYDINISLLDNTGKVLVKSVITAPQKNQINSWIYQWHHLGSQTLKIPEVNWFYDYYTDMERFNIIDYAAYVFERFDDLYIEFLAQRLLSGKNLKTDVEKINYIASFVQALEYKKDNSENESYEYPRYPLETLKELGGDCEDKAILTAAVLVSLGYNVSLIRLPQHMAVGVHLDETLQLYSCYIDRYYFLETTTLFMPLGKIPTEYQNLTNVTVYPISSRSLISHSWKNATRFEISNGVDYVTVTMIIENLGIIAVSNIEVRGAFYDNESQLYNLEIVMVPLLIAGEKYLLELSVDVLSSVSTTLKTQLYLNGTMVNQRESMSRFP